jgi:hypothetical protein
MEIFDEYLDKLTETVSLVDHKTEEKKIEASPLGYAHHLFPHVQIPLFFLFDLVAFFSLQDPSLLLSA